MDDVAKLGPVAQPPPWSTEGKRFLERAFEDPLVATRGTRIWQLTGTRPSSCTGSRAPEGSRPLRRTVGNRILLVHKFADNHTQNTIHYGFALGAGAGRNRVPTTVGVRVRGSSCRAEGIAFPDRSSTGSNSWATGPLSTVEPADEIKV